MADPLQDAENVLAKMAYAQWLKVHGKLTRPEMSKKQQLELKECFELIDSGGSGAITTREVRLAFSVLGMDVKRPEIDALLAEVDPENNGFIEYPQFMQIMMTKLDRLPSDAYAPRDDGEVVRQSAWRVERGQEVLELLYSQGGLVAAHRNPEHFRRKILIEAVMGGDKPLQDRMNYRSGQVDKELRALRDEAAGNPKQELKKNWSMTLSPSQREKQRARVAKSKNRQKKDKTPKPMPIPSYLVETMDADMKEVLLGNTPKSLKKAVSASKVKFVPPTDKSDDIDRPWSVNAGSTANLNLMDESSTTPGSRMDEAYKQEKLEVFRSEIRHKPTFKQQVVHVQAMKTLRDFHKHGLWEVKGSPFIFPASLR